MMGSGAIVEEKKIEQSIRQVPRHSFTVLDFIKALRSIYPEDWEGLVEDAKETYGTNDHQYCSDAAQVLV
jgi:hypothetical protein